MKKSIILFSSILVAVFSFSAQSQNSHYGKHDHLHYDTSFFKYGNLIYDKSYKGISELMKNIQEEDQELYSKMIPAFEIIKTKKYKSRKIFYSTAAVGGLITLSGFTFAQDNLESSFGNEKQPNTLLVAGGLGLILTGGIVALFTGPKVQDYYTLININNKYNKKNKIRWGVGYDLASNSNTLKLSYVF